MDLPEDFSGLKRPALQALCKKHGIKANGKNTDMIKALEQIKREGAQPVEDTLGPAVEQERCESHSSPSISEAAKMKKKAVRRNKGGKKKRSRQGRKSEGTLTASFSADSELSEITEDSLPQHQYVDINSGTHSNPDDSVTNSSHSQPMNSPTQPNPSSQPSAHTVSRKRQRRDTYSVSPSSSLGSLAKIPRLSPSISIAPVTDCIQNKSATCATPVETTPPTDEPPFSPPPENAIISSSSKCKRHSTFIVSPSPAKTSTAKYPAAGDVSQSSGKNEKMVNSSIDIDRVSNADKMVETNKNGERRSIFDLTPVVHNTTATPGRRLSSSDMIMAELQNILDKRVEEIKSSPGYKPVFGMSDIPSRLSVKTNTEKKFDRAHSKHFDKMKSIVSVQQERKRKRLMDNAPSCAKRSKFASTRFQPKASTNKLSHDLNSKTTVTSSAVVFNPTITTTQKTKFKFSKSTDKAPGSQLKTPKKVMTTFAAKESPLHSSKKPVYSLEASLKRRPLNYKPYTGPIPKFEAARY